MKMFLLELSLEKHRKNIEKKVGSIFHSIYHVCFSTIPIACRIFHRGLVLLVVAMPSLFFNIISAI